MDGTAAPSGTDAHFVLYIRYVDQTVEGEVVRTGATEPETFSGWLDLLRLLEGPLPEGANGDGTNGCHK